MFDSVKCDLKKVQLKVMRGNSDLEILAVSGKLKGSAREMAILACYLLPSFKKAEDSRFIEVLSNCIAELKTKMSGGWVTVGGDFNDRDLTNITSLFPDIEKVFSEPTRKKATLDVFYVNYSDYITLIEVNHPLQSDRIGSDSDH